MWKEWDTIQRFANPFTDGRANIETDFELEIQSLFCVLGLCRSRPAVLFLAAVVTLCHWRKVARRKPPKFYTHCRHSASISTCNLSLLVNQIDSCPESHIIPWKRMSRVGKTLAAGRISAGLLIVSSHTFILLLFLFVFSIFGIYIFRKRHSIIHQLLTSFPKRRGVVPLFKMNSHFSRLHWSGHTRPYVKHYVYLILHKLAS